jgi:hypothetical protein
MSGWGLVHAARRLTDGGGSAVAGSGAADRVEDLRSRSAIAFDYRVLAGLGRGEPLRGEGVEDVRFERDDRIR